MSLENGLFVVKHKETIKAAVWIISLLAVVAFMQNKDANASIEQQNYIKSLESIVGQCTERGDHPLSVDGELWMCGAAPTGIRLEGKV